VRYLLDTNIILRLADENAIELASSGKQSGELLFREASLPSFLKFFMSFGIPVLDHYLLTVSDGAAHGLEMKSKGCLYVFCSCLRRRRYLVPGSSWSPRTECQASKFTTRG